MNFRSILLEDVKCRPQ